MAPVRRSCAGRAKAEAQLRPGDLVLAKVRGFPAWPAKIGRPEDWGRVPDRKKYFVEFFGTSEIAFIAPVDIQLFTNESKSELLTRSQGKTIKNFACAVEEICEAFERFHHQSPVQVGEAMDRNADDTVGPVDCKHLVDCEMTEVEHKILDRKGSCENEHLSDKLPVWEHCSQSSETAHLEATSCGTDSPVLSVQQRNEASHNGRRLQKGEISAPEISTTSFKDEAFSCHPVHIEQKGLEVPLGAKVIETLLNGSVSSESKQLCDPELNVREGSIALAASSNLKGEVVQKAADVVHGMIMLVPERKMEVVLALEAPQKCIPRELMKDALVTDCVEFPQKRRISVEESKITAACGIVGKSYEMPTELERTIKKEKRLDSLKDYKKYSSRKDTSHMVSNIVKQDIFKGYDIELSLPSEEFARKNSHSLNKTCSQEGAGESPEAKSSKCVGHNTRGSRNHEFSHSTTKYKKFVKGKRSVCVTAENLSTCKSEAHNHMSQSPNNEVLLPPRKRKCMESVIVAPSTTKSAAETDKKTDSMNDILSSDCKRSALIQVNSRRRLCRFDNDVHDEHKTPVHRGSFCALMPEHSDEPVPVDISHLHSENHIDSLSNVNKVIKQLSSTRRVRPSSDKISTGNDGDDSLSSGSRKIKEEKPENFLRMHSPLNVGKEEYPRSSSKLHARALILPKASEDCEDAPKMPKHKTIKSGLKISDTTLLEKAKASSFKLPNLASESVSRSCNHVATRENKSPFSTMKLEVTLPSKLQMTVVPENRSDIILSAECKNEAIRPGERLVATKEDDGTSLFMDTKYVDPSKSLKYLIEAAQEKRRHVNAQSLSNDNLMSDPFSNLHAIHERSCSPLSAAHPFSSGISVGKDVHGSYAPSAGSLSMSPKEFPLEPEKYERRNPPGCQPLYVSLGDATRAAVSCDTLEGMIKTLSRTKESIRRTTRYAINCAKYGIAGEVTELLMRKLESEPSYHRRVDLLFLVDSIVQCSHNQKGSKEASYISSVKAALPRLLRAAAPPGSGAHENRRQCLKVLRLWIERNILPESLLRPYMEDIEVSGDQASGGNFVRCPSQIERSIDDPLREMEGILIDEYGSNATFQFPEIVSSTVFKDEKDLPRSLCNKVGHDSPAEAEGEFQEPVTSVITPIDRHHHMLEGVEGELKMEDLSATPKDDKSISLNSSVIPDSCHQISRTLESVPDNSTELYLAHENQSLQIVEYAAIQRYDNAAAMSDLVRKKAVDYVITGSRKTQYTSSKLFEYGSQDVHAAPRTSHRNRQFQSDGTSFRQRPRYSLPHVKRPPSRFLPTGNTSSKHMGHKHMGQEFSTYALSSRPNGWRRYATTEQRKSHSGFIGQKNQNRALLAGARTSSSQASAFVHDGYFRSERKVESSSSAGFHHSSHGAKQSGVSVQGDILPWMSRWKPNARSRNCWGAMESYHEV